MNIVGRHLLTRARLAWSGITRWPPPRPVHILHQLLHPPLPVDRSSFLLSRLDLPSKRRAVSVPAKPARDAPLNVAHVHPVRHRVLHVPLLSKIGVAVTINSPAFAACKNIGDGSPSFQAEHLGRSEPASRKNLNWKS